MITVYICSPYRGSEEEIKRNVEYAKELTALALNSGFAPITPHLYLTQVTNDEIPEERAAGLYAGKQILEKCDVVIMGCKYGTSEGMLAEVQLARSRRIPIIESEIYTNAEDFIRAVRCAAFKCTVI